jgi:hypothetical protein
MTETESVFALAYSAFDHAGRIDGTLALMSDSVSCQKHLKVGVWSGRRRFNVTASARQEFDPPVDPLEVLDRKSGSIQVRVCQVVTSLSGDVLTDTEVWHVYTVANGLI